MRRADRGQGPQGRTLKRSGGVDGGSTSLKIEVLVPGRREKECVKRHARPHPEVDRAAAMGNLRRRLGRRLDGALQRAWRSPPPLIVSLGVAVGGCCSADAPSEESRFPLPSLDCALSTLESLRALRPYLPSRRFGPLLACPPAWLL
jgi:hypothetical protein